MVDDSKLTTDEEFRLRPIDIEFGQDSIKMDFTDKKYGSVLSLCEEIVSGKTKVDDVDPLMVAKSGGGAGRWFCYQGNRRLYIWKKLYHYRLCGPVRVKIYNGQKQISSKLPRRSLEIRGCDDEVAAFERGLYRMFDGVHAAMYPNIPQDLLF